MEKFNIAISLNMATTATSLHKQGWIDAERGRDDIKCGLSAKIPNQEADHGDGGRGQNGEQYQR